MKSAPTQALPNHYQDMKTDHLSFLQPFFEAMNVSFAHKWCVLHSYESLPYHSDSDVDMAFSGADLDSLEQLIYAVAGETNWKVYQKFWYDVERCSYYVLRENSSGVLLAIDFLVDNQGIGRYGFKTTLLTHQCDIVKKLIPIPNPQTALLYKLVKRIEKERPLQADAQYLKDHFSKSDKSEIIIFLRKQYGQAGCESLLSFLEGSTATLDQGHISALKQERKKRIRSLAKKSSYYVWETKRIMSRFMAPSGMIITTPLLAPSHLKEFKHLLAKKTGILFRFVTLDLDKSRIKQLKGLSGSTLVISPSKKFNVDRAIQYRANPAKYFPVPKSILDTNDMTALASVYFEYILSALSKRLSSN